MSKERFRRSFSQTCASTAAPSNYLPLDSAPRVHVGPGVEGRYGLCSAGSILENPDAVQTHSKKQVRKIARSMQVAGTLTPLVIDETYTLLAGHARLAAAKENGMDTIPVLQVFGLTRAQKRAFLLADNRTGEEAGLDRAKLASQLQELEILFEEAGFELTDTGFEVAELDELVIDMEGEPGSEEDALDEDLFEEPLIMRTGDLMALGEHLLIVGDARDPDTFETLMPGERAEAAFLDPPYNVRVRDIGGRGRMRHPEFAFASGEMTRPEYVSFLISSFSVVADRCVPGSIVFSCIDAQHVRDMLDAAESVFQAYLTLVVWNKTNAGQGGLYRNQHELIGVFRVGDETHRDNVQKGRFGRNRSNVWTYAGANTFRAGRMEDLAAHPTVKPTRLVADALKDVTRRGAIILDTFVGSGTTILAAEKTGRRARAVEIEPRYAQAAARRWEQLTGRDAVHVASGMTLDELAQARERSPEVEPGTVSTEAAQVPRVRVRPRPPVLA